MLMTTRNIART